MYYVWPRSLSRPWPRDVNRERRFYFGPTIVDVYPDHTKTTLADGWVITGAPEDTDAYRATAVQYGYGTDTLMLCKEHETVHAALSYWLGLGESPVLRAVAHGLPATDMTRLEETAVLAIQQFAQAAGISLLASLRSDEIDPVGK